MSISVRRKRKSRDLRCILFPEDVKDTLRITSSETKMPVSSSLKSWQRCGDGFLDTPIQKKTKTVGQKHATARQSLLQTPAEYREEPVHIAWSSSESEPSDCEDKSPPPRTVVTPKQCQSQPQHKPRLNVSSYLQLLNSEADELPAIESGSDLSDEDDEVRGHQEKEPDNSGAISDCNSPEKDKSEEKQPRETQIVPDVDISDYPSDGEGSTAGEMASSNVAEPDPVDSTGRRLLSDWVRSAQALLQTPQKQANCQFKTPDDSNKKRRKFESGGLAERLNQLQSRQRSAVSFWRHQSTADSTATTTTPAAAAGKLGVLALRVLHVQEDCGLSVVRCQRLQEAQNPTEEQQNPAQEQQNPAQEQQNPAPEQQDEQENPAQEQQDEQEDPVEEQQDEQEDPAQEQQDEQEDPAQEQQDAVEEQEVPAERDHCLVLFSRETVTHLAPSPGDLVHVHPPWQTLVIEGESRSVILSTHFSQKVLSAGRRNHADPSPKHRPHALRCSPYPLNHSWGLWLDQRRASPAQRDRGGSRQTGVCERVWPEPRGVCDSLLEALESPGPAGALEQRLQVALQRVYCLPIPQSSALRLHGLRRSPHAPSPHTPSPRNSSNSPGRLCVLVQDAWGMFSEVQLQALVSEEQLQHHVLQWEGRSCLLQGVKVLRRVTRDRCAPLFSLIDSLWPPTLPLRVHGDAVSCEESRSTAPAAPSFCYRLSGSEASVVVSQELPMSPLYLPPVMQSLKDILQGGREGGRCSFTANVVFSRLQPSGSGAGDAESWLLFVTDASLQGEEEEEPRPGCCRRTLPVCLSPSHVLQRSVRQALASQSSSSSSSSSSSCHLTLKDVLLQRGCIVCLEQSTVRLAPASTGASLHPDPLAQPVLLDQLGPDTPPHTLCRLTGVVVGVDEETAYSWPVCSRCESERLERAPATQEGFFCTVCDTEVVRPTIKMQLEVFLSCPSLIDCTIRIKLQQKTIDSVLSSLVSDPAFCEVESVLGKEVGPVSAYVRVITRTSGLWVGLEEISL